MDKEEIVTAGRRASAYLRGYNWVMQMRKTMTFQDTCCLWARVSSSQDSFDVGCVNALLDLRISGDEP